MMDHYRGEHDAELYRNMRKDRESKKDEPAPTPSREDLMAFVSAQAEDEGLWFEALTAPEAYLQQELRRLHAVIEGESVPGSGGSGQQSRGIAAPGTGPISKPMDAPGPDLKPDAPSGEGAEQICPSCEDRVLVLVPESMKDGEAIWCRNGHRLSVEWTDSDVEDVHLLPHVYQPPQLTPEEVAEIRAEEDDEPDAPSGKALLAENERLRKFRDNVVHDWSVAMSLSTIAKASLLELYRKTLPGNYACCEHMKVYGWCGGHESKPAADERGKGE